MGDVRLRRPLRRLGLLLAAERPRGLARLVRDPTDQPDHDHGDDMDNGTFYFKLRLRNNGALDIDYFTRGNITQLADANQRIDAIDRLLDHPDVAARVAARHGRRYPAGGPERLDEPDVPDLDRLRTEFVHEFARWWCDGPGAAFRSSSVTDAGRPLLDALDAARDRAGE